jgi:hypothetical protein
MRQRRSLSNHTGVRFKLNMARGLSRRFCGERPGRFNRAGVETSAVRTVCKLNVFDVRKKPMRVTNQQRLFYNIVSFHFDASNLMSSRIRCDGNRNMMRWIQSRVETVQIKFNQWIIVSILRKGFMIPTSTSLVNRKMWFPLFCNPHFFNILVAETKSNWSFW